MTTESIIVRYANKLATQDIAGLSGNAQNLMSLLFSIWTKRPNASTIIPLDEIKTRLELTHQTDEYLNGVINSIAKAIINKSFVDGYDENGNQIVGYMIYQFKTVKTDHTLEIQTSPDFMRLFEQLLDGYTEYDFLTFYAIQSKQGKNLYRLFRRYYRGTCILAWDELRLWLGYKSKSQNRNIMQAIKKAIKYLVEQNFLKTCVVTPIYSTCRGNRIQKIKFDYTFPNKQLNTVEDTPKSSEASAQDAKGIEIPPEKNENTQIPEQVTANLESPETTQPVVFPDFANVRPMSAAEAQLPDPAMCIPPIEAQKADEAKKAREANPKKLEKQCFNCKGQLKYNTNSTTHQHFWFCPQCGNHVKTLTFTPEEEALLAIKETEIYQNKHDKD